MTRDEIIMICTCDLGGQVRGKGFPASDLAARLRRGIGWTPTNSMITAHGPIAPSPWGPFGDLVLMPDPDTEVRVDMGEAHAAEHFLLADICHLDGTPWAVCPRGFLKRVLAALEARHGLGVRAAFEHEFIYEAVAERPNSSYALDAFRRQDAFAETYLGALREAGLTLDTFMPEYGPMQYEVTVGPAVGRARGRPGGGGARDRPLGGGPHGQPGQLHADPAARRGRQRGACAFQPVPDGR